jgi:predicted GIY-YIG superfamily endonuclease
MVIYVLRCQPGDKYYVGKTTKAVELRMIEHATAWTTKHPPMEIVCTHEQTSPFDEDKYVKEYMIKYGIDNVRGGTYSSVALSPAVRKMIQGEMDTATDACFRCHRKGHFANRCFAKTYKDGRPIFQSMEREKQPNPNGFHDRTRTTSSVCNGGGHYEWPRPNPNDIDDAAACCCCLPRTRTTAHVTVPLLQADTRN